jgi:hypothetical protein
VTVSAMNVTVHVLEIFCALFTCYLIISLLQLRNMKMLLKHLQKQEMLSNLPTYGNQVIVIMIVVVEADYFILIRQ